MIRPSAREIDKRLSEARIAAEQGHFLLVEPDAILADLLELNLLAADLPKVFLELLKEISFQNYSGRRPPQKSYERAILNLELFAFAWDSIRLGCKMYLKFALRNDRLWITSLHKSRDRKDGSQ